MHYLWPYLPDRDGIEPGFQAGDSQKEQQKHGRYVVIGALSFGEFLRYMRGREFEAKISLFDLF